MLDKQAVFFDIDDTLLDNYCAFKETIQEFFPGSLKEFALKRLYRNFRQKSEKIYQSYLDGNRKHKADRWRLVLQTLQPTSIVNISELDDYYHLRQGKQLLSKEMQLLLRSLKKSGILCGVLTNGFMLQQQNKIDQLMLNQFIDPNWQFISEEIDDAKPNVSCFQKVAKQLPEQIQRIYYLGDSYSNDIIPAQMAGWRPIWLNRFGDKGESAIIQAKNAEEAVVLLLSQLLSNRV